MLFFANYCHLLSFSRNYKIVMSLTFALKETCFTTSVMIKILARVTRNKFPALLPPSQFPHKPVSPPNQVPCQIRYSTKPVSPSKLFPKTFFSKDKLSIVLEQICDVFQYHTLLPRFLTLSVTFNMRACNNFQNLKRIIAVNWIMCFY